MGRALLLTCLGSFVILGIVQQAVQQRQLAMTEGNIETFQVNHARNANNSGLEMGIHRVIHTEDWESEPQPWYFPVGGIEVEVLADKDDHADVPSGYVRVLATTDVGRRTIESFAFLTDDVITPPVHGALGFYGEGSQVRLGGNANIYGFDTNPSSDPEVGDGDGEDLPGIASVDEEDDLIDQYGNAEYDGDPPFMQQDLDGQELHDLIEMYKEQRDDFYVPGDLGTPENPKITVIEEDMKFEENTNAAGILIITEGTTLDLRGTFSFEGLVIVQGELDIRGNVKIFGAMMFGDNALLEIDEGSDGDFSGNTDIYYSSSALQNINEKLGYRFDHAGMVVDRIFY